MNHLLQHRLFQKPPPRSDSSIKVDVENGHTYHCAARMNWGDGECECGLLEREEIASTISFQDSSASAPIYEDRWVQRYLEWRVDQGHFE